MRILSPKQMYRRRRSDTNLTLLGRSKSGNAKSKTDDVPLPEAASSGRYTVDLAKVAALPALDFLKESMASRNHVQSLSINAESFVWRGLMFHSVFVEAFTIFGQLPNLKRVTIDLSCLDLPVEALAALFQGTNTELCELELRNLHLVGDCHVLDQALQHATSTLSSIKMESCHGVGILSLMKAPGLQQFDMRYCEIDETKVSTSKDRHEAWTALGRSSTLQSLTLREIIDLKTENLVAFARALQWRQDHHQTNNNGELLQELHIAASLRTLPECEEKFGSILSEILLHQQSSIQTLSLKFEDNWTNVGTAMAAVLEHQNRTSSAAPLTSMSVGLAGTTALKQATQVAHALASNASLERLKLCFDQDRLLDGPLDESFVTAMESVLLEHNHTLEKLVLMDDNLDHFPLSLGMQEKLNLNASTLPRLLSFGQADSQDYVSAMIDAKDNLNAVFFALSNNPNLLLHASPSSSTTTAATLESFAGMRNSSSTATLSDLSSGTLFDESPACAKGTKKGSSMRTPKQVRKAARAARQRLFDLMSATKTLQAA